MIGDREDDDTAGNLAVRVCLLAALLIGIVLVIVCTAHQPRRELAPTRQYAFIVKTSGTEFNCVAEHKRFATVGNGTLVICTPVLHSPHRPTKAYALPEPPPAAPQSFTPSPNCCQEGVYES